MLLRRLTATPADLVQMQEGTVVFVDISGFTRLSERLARSGREGAEQLTDTINACFSALLANAYVNGGSLLKFGGDALLLWFEDEDHALRACASAAAMRRTLRSFGPVQAGATSIVLRMSIGVHTGTYHHFLVGGSHREHLIAGPAASEVVAMEAAASAGQVLMSPATAGRLPRRSVGRALGPGVLLARAPSSLEPVAGERPLTVADDVLAQCLSTEVRAYLRAGSAQPEHRNATIAFVQFGGLDSMLSSGDSVTGAVALDDLVQIVQEAADRYEVCLLGSDIAAGGGKLLLTAGTPRAVGDDEERMLLALRQIVECESPLPVRIGVNRGPVFAGEIGPEYRRAYTVMGDDVNLAARLMAKAPWGQIYATHGVLDCSQIGFERTTVPPFMVKGKRRPVEAYEVGPASRETRRKGVRRTLPLVGRDRELAVLAAAAKDARGGTGSMVELVGETGSGKSRLLSEARALAADFRFVHTTGETYTQMTPYASWRDPLRQLLGLSWNDSDDVVLARLRHELDTHHPDLRPWLPLLAIALDAEAPSTPEVDQLAPDFRAAKLHEVVLLFLAPAFAIPTLVQVEHAHQLDAASASLLEALAGELERSSWLVLVTRREAEQGFVAPAGTSQRLELEPLTQDDLRTLAEHTPEAHLIPPHLLELAVQRSGGSPEFLLDLLAAGAAGGEDESLPDNLESAAMIRIDALEPSDRSLVRRASVLGVSFHPRRLAQVLESGSAGLDADAASRLSGIFAYDPDGHVRFKRPALRDVAYASLPFRLRRQLHAALADALERDIGLDVDADPAVVSLHFILAGDPEKAWRYALVGADRATELSAHADAAQLYQRAIEAGRADGASEAELASAWEKLAEALRSTGQPDAAHTALTMARRIDPGDPLRDARLLYAHAEICEQTGRLSASVRWVSRGLRAIEGLEDREAVAWRARLQSRLAGIRSRQGRPKEAERIARRVILDAEAADALYALAHACYVLDWALVELGRASEAVHSARALEIFRSLGDLNREAYVLNNLGMFAYFRGSWDEAIDLYRESARCAAKAGDAAAPAFAEMNIAEILSDQGRLEEAAEHLNRCRRILASTRDQDSVPFVDVLLGRLAVRAGRPHDALEPLENAREQFLRMRLAVDAEFASLVIAEAHTFGGNPSEALRTLNALRSTRDPYVAMAHRLRGISKALLGDRAAAIKELSASLAAARERKAEYDIASALDALEQLGPPAPERQVERDALLARLGVARLLRLQPDRAPVG